MSDSKTDCSGPRSVQITGDLFRARAGGLARYVDGLARALSPNASTRVIGIGLTDDPDAAASADASLPRRLHSIRSRVVATLPHTDLLATHFAPYAFSVLDFLRKRPHVLHFHGPWAAESKAEGDSRPAVAMKRLIERQVYATADRAITLSRAFARILIEEYRVSEDRVHVIPGGIVPPSSPLADRLVAREQLRTVRTGLDDGGWPSDRPIVLCVRRLARRMGIDVLIDAAKILRRSHPDILIVIAGKGLIRDELQAGIDSAGLRSQVKLLGFVSDDQLSLAYAAADLSIVPSQSLEGFGLTTLESLVQGTPVLVTPVGGLPEVVGALHEPLILPSAGAEAIADGIDSALRTPSQLPDRDRCRRYAVEHFGWPDIAARTLDVYRKAIIDAAEESRR